MPGKLSVQIDNRAFARSVAALVLPMALQNLINVAVSSADVIMLGLVGEETLSASSLAGQVQYVMMLICFGLGSGASVLTAQYWGKGDTRTIEKTVAIAMRLAFCVALVFFILAQTIPAALMRIFTPEQNIIELGVVYLRIVSPSFLLMCVTNIYLNIMRSVEKVIFSTVVYSISLVANIVMNAVLIFGLLGFPAMGIAGAALATTLARVLEMVIVVVYALRNKVLRLRARDFVTHNAVLFRDFMRYAMPTTLNEMLWGMAMSANAVIIGHLGSAAVASNSVAQVARQLATVVSFGVANATAIMVGKALGAGEPARAEAYASRLLKIAVVLGIGGGLVILALRPAIVAVVNLSDLANSYLRFQLLIMSGYALAQAVSAVGVVGIFRGGGDTRFGLALDVGTMWCCSIPLASLAAFVFGAPVQVVFAIILCDEFIKVPICLWRYRSKRWLRNVTRDMV